MVSRSGHTDITVHFINAVLEGSPRITDVELLNPILDKDSVSDKVAILDVRARDDQGRWLNIEMQTTLPAGLRQRLTYYVSSLYVSQLQEGAGYATLQPAVSICVLDRLVFREVSDPHLAFQLREGRHGLVLSDHLQVHLLELPKYNPVEDALRSASALEKWLYFLRFAADLSLDEIEARLSDGAFREAAGVLEMISQTPRERELYEARLKMERDEAARLLGAREEGREEGKRLGNLIGVVQTLQQLLGIEASTSEDLEARSEEKLAEMVATLRSRLRDRNVS